MRSIVVILLSVVVFTLSCSAQSDTAFNQVDERGLKQGLWKRTMNDNGKTYLYAIENYKDGKRNGLCTYFFPNGKKESESYYRNDTLDGLSKVYKIYGGLRYEENFKDGRTHGFKKYYSVDGELTEEQEYTEGVQTGIYHLYSKSKRVIVESFYINGIENGTRKVYSDNDKHEIIREFDFKNDIKIAARYFKKGKIVKHEKYNYEDGLKKDEELKKKYQAIDG
jgi:antitoxin component YwqK of YwqJK toxin-antitoxin module